MPETTGADASMLNITAPNEEGMGEVINLCSDDEDGPRSKRRHTTRIHVSRPRSEGRRETSRASVHLSREGREEHRGRGYDRTARPGTPEIDTGGASLSQKDGTIRHETGSVEVVQRFRGVFLGPPSLNMGAPRFQCLFFNCDGPLKIPSTNFDEVGVESC